MTRVEALGYLGFRVKSLEDWEVFATEILGMTATRAAIDGEEAVVLRMDERAHRITARVGDDELDYIGWQVSGPDALDEVAAALTAAGVAYNDDAGLAEMRGVRRLLRCTDPAGYTLEFHYGATMLQEPFVSPTGARFVTTAPDGADTGLGHVVVVCDNVEETTEFYRRVLGFKVSDHIIPVPGMLLTFLHTNPRHHSLAVAPVYKDGPTGINHFMVEVDDLDVVGRALDRVHQRKIRQLASLGRHTNDKMLSFYVQSPSGFGIEYGTDGLLIDDETWSVVTYDASAYWGHTFDPA
ncbi:VOC family protein [Pseudonocardia sp. GCM10023141]|uniref:VOC family protein n=1 Tax=Pseudonocardia sp. GCM10023141 TaxID=3252653 RepID=UPI00361936E5